MDFPSYNSSTSYCIGSVLVQVVKKQENIILPETNKEKVDPRIRIELCACAILDKQDALKSVFEEQEANILFLGLKILCRIYQAVRNRRRGRRQQQEDNLSVNFSTHN